MWRLVVIAVLLLFLVGVPLGMIRSLRRRRSQDDLLPGKGRKPELLPERGWAKLAEKSERFRETLQVREWIVSLVVGQEQDSRFAELLEEVDCLIDRIAHNLRVLEQTETHLAAFDPAHLADKEADLRHRQDRAQDEDARRFIGASLYQLERQRSTRKAIRARAERLFSSVDHSLIQLQAVHLDLINVVSAGIHSGAGQLVIIKERIRDLGEELGMGAMENDEFASLLISDEVGEEQEPSDVPIGSLPPNP